MYGANPINTGDIAKSIVTSDLWATLESEFGSPSHRAGVDVEVAIGTPLMEGLHEAVKEIELLKRDIVVEGVYRQMPNLTKTGIVNVYWCVLCYFRVSFISLWLFLMKEPLFSIASRMISSKARV
jgi:hypothetical protein